MNLLHRLGGYLVRPRAHAATLRASEVRWDAPIVALLYVVGTSVYPVVEAVAAFWAVRDWNGLLMFASAVGRVVIAPILVLVASETLLGSARSYQRAVGLLPLLIVATLAHASRQLGWAMPGGPFMPDIVGGVLGLGLAWWIRGHVEPLAEDDA